MKKDYRKKIGFDDCKVGFIRVDTQTEYIISCLCEYFNEKEKLELFDNALERTNKKYV